MPAAPKGKAGRDRPTMEEGLGLSLGVTGCSLTLLQVLLVVPRFLVVHEILHPGSGLGRAARDNAAEAIA